MSIYVLVHGAWCGIWCWEKVVFFLQQAGQNTIVLDLPGRAGDITPINEISLELHANKVCDVVNLQSEPVILVGHSMGGMVITQAAEYCSDRINTLVYLCAYLPQNGQSMLDLAQTDKQSLAQHNTRIDNNGYLSLKKDAGLKDMLFADCSDRDIERAKIMLIPEPIAPMSTPVKTTEEKYGRIPRVYIECLQDKAITPYLQKQMYTKVSCQKVFSMDTSHSPFFSAPYKLVEHLISLS